MDFKTFPSADFWNKSCLYLFNIDLGKMEHLGSQDFRARFREIWHLATSDGGGSVLEKYCFIFEKINHSSPK